MRTTVLVNNYSSSPGLASCDVGFFYCDFWRSRRRHIWGPLPPPYHNLRSPPACKKSHAEPTPSDPGGYQPFKASVGRVPGISRAAKHGKSEGIKSSPASLGMLEHRQVQASRGGLLGHEPIFFSDRARSRSSRWSSRDRLLAPVPTCRPSTAASSASPGCCRSPASCCRSRCAAARAAFLAPPLRQGLGRLGAAFILPFAGDPRRADGAYEFVHLLLLEYIPFIILLPALFTVAGGIHIRGNLHGSPALNTALLAIGTVLASLMGTTGASMLLIRPLIRANDNRRHKVHVVVFFIFLVSNIGGSLTPLGDPPLFLGFLKGVDFFWTTKHLFAEMLVVRHRPARAVLCASTALATARKASCQRDPTPDIAGAHRRRHQLPAAGRRRRRRAAERRRGSPACSSTSSTSTSSCSTSCATWRSIAISAAVAGDHRTPSCAADNQLQLGADGRGRQAVRRHLPHHRPGDRDAARPARDGALRRRWSRW